jgi:hypothetical protein
MNSQYRPHIPTPSRPQYIGARLHPRGSGRHPTAPPCIPRHPQRAGTHSEAPPSTTKQPRRARAPHDLLSTKTGPRTVRTPTYDETKTTYRGTYPEENKGPLHTHPRHNPEQHIKGGCPQTATPHPPTLKGNGAAPHHASEKRKGEKTPTHTKISTTGK